MQNSNNQVSVQNGIQAQQEVRRPEQDTEYERLLENCDFDGNINLDEESDECIEDNDLYRLFSANSTILQKIIKSKE